MEGFWHHISRLAEICTILGAVPALFCGIRWFVARLGERRSAGLFVWAIVGDENEQVLFATLKGIGKLAFAAVVWAVIGSACGMLTTGLLVVLRSIAAGQTAATEASLRQGGVAGGLTGVVVRTLVWPFVSRKLWRARTRQKAFDAKRAFISSQQTRVQDRLKREEENDGS